MFKDNEYFKEMKFIIHPLLREKLHVAADMLASYDLEKIKENWSDKLQNIEI
jgi:hypothetical protein